MTKSKDGVKDLVARPMLERAPPPMHWIADLRRKKQGKSLRQHPGGDSPRYCCCDQTVSAEATDIIILCSFMRSAVLDLWQIVHLVIPPALQ